MSDRKLIQTTDVQKLRATKKHIYSSHGSIIIEGAEEGEKIDIYNTLGKRIWTGAATENTLEVNLPNGIYVISGYENPILVRN
jgi:hypothetical protein